MNPTQTSSQSPQEAPSSSLPNVTIDRLTPEQARLLIAAIEETERQEAEEGDTAVPS